VEPMATGLAAAVEAVVEDGHLCGLDHRRRRERAW